MIGWLLFACCLWLISAAIYAICAAANSGIGHPATGVLSRNPAQAPAPIKEGPNHI